MSAAWPDSPFWDFSLALYTRPGVEAACLDLQETHRLDVNLVLLAAWLAQDGRCLAPPLAARMRELGDGYQARVMQPLREARRALKAHDPGADLDPLRADCRRALLAVELDLERLEQLQLATLAAGAGNDATSPPEALLQRNLEVLYPDRELPRDIVSLLAARFIQPLSAASTEQASA